MKTDGVTTTRAKATSTVLAAAGVRGMLKCFAGRSPDGTRAHRHARLTLQRRLTKAAVSLALAMAAILPAQAQLATGGQGRFRSQIVWLSWGAHGATIPQAGLTRVNSINIDGQFLRVSCSLSNIAGAGADPDLIAYRPGNWGGDGLDDLYNITGVGTNNTLVVGLNIRNDGALVSGRFSCSATLGPNNNASDPAYPLEGLVFADAEQSSSMTGTGEFVQATVPATATWRIIDRFSACGLTSSATVTTATGGNQTLRFDGSNPICNPPQGGPIGVGFMDGATAADFSLKGGGRSAIALGVMVFVVEQGDAPDSYGSALHLPGFTWNGGTLPGSNAGTTTNYFGAFPMANLAQPLVRLGAIVDIEQSNLSNAGATGDDSNGSDDEDSVGAIAPIPLAAGRVYTLNGVTCGTGGIVYGYIDFNRDGDFADTGERSAATSCSGGSVGAVNWTMPTAANLRPGASFLRLRIGSDDTQVGVPVGISNDGEVEDHAVTLAAPVVRVQKITANQGAGPFSFTATNLTGAIANITTSAAGTAQPANPAALPVATMGAAVTLIETPAAGWVQQAATCNDANSANTNNVNPVATATTGAVTIPAAVTATAADVTCVFTNIRPSSLQLSKAWAAGSIAGNQVTIGASTGGANNTVSFNATAPNAANSGTAVVVNIGDVITLPAETGTDVGNYTTTLACSGGHTLSGTNGQLANTLTITSGNAAACTYTNAVRTASLTLRKQWSGAAVGDDATITVSRAGAVVDTLASDAGTADELDTDATPTIVMLGETVTLAEALAAANAGAYDTILACTGTADVDPSDGLSVGAADTAIVCTYTNAHRSSDLSITKTNTPAAGALDQANDTVNSAQATTYTLVVTNNGAAAITGAVVRDTPDTGITCPPGNPVSITGDGVPAGSFTVADLTSATGIVLATLAAGQSTTLSFACQVN